MGRKEGTIIVYPVYPTACRRVANPSYIAYCARLLCWHPCGEQQQKRRKILQASHPDLSCRFVKEASMGKSELLADIDHVDAPLDRENSDARDMHAFVFNT